MSKTAAELADLIVEKKIRMIQNAKESLKQKIVDATTEMVSNLSLSTEIEIADQDTVALAPVTEAMREMGYKFRFIEVQDLAGETVKHKLFISIEHLA